MKRIYLANPYGFSVQQRDILLPIIVKKLESLGLTVWEPFERNNQVDWTNDKYASFKVGLQDAIDVRSADAIFAICNGNPPDEGVMIELGMAIAYRMPTFLFRDDFRRCCDSNDYPLNLMLFVGLPKDSWRDYYYTSVDEITDPNKMLAQWAVL